MSEKTVDIELDENEDDEFLAIYWQEYWTEFYNDIWLWTNT